MPRRLRFGVLSVVSASAIWAASLGCSSPSGGDPTAPPRMEATDPGCKVIAQSPAQDGGRALSVIHEAQATDAGAIDASTDGPSEAGTDVDAGPMDDGGSPSAADAAPPGETITADTVRTVACREGTTLDVAAGPNGGLFVSGAQIGAQLVSFSEGEPTTRVVEYLETKNAIARVATLEDGRPLLVGLRTKDGKLAVEEGVSPSGPRTFDTESIASLGRASTNAGGTILLPVGNKMLVRTSAGAIAIAPFTTSAGSNNLSGVPVYGIGNDDRPFRLQGSVLSLADRNVTLSGIDSVRSAAFAPLDASIALPALALVRGSGKEGEIAGLEVAIPASDDYARVQVVPTPKPCASDAACNNDCTEENVEVEPKEVAMARADGVTYVAFVRRSVKRERRYRKQSSSGFLCDFFGCAPDCTTSSSSTTTASELVIATIDPASRTVRERFSQALVGKGGPRPVLLGKGVPYEMGAYGRDGWLHVAFHGKYEGQFNAVTTYRFRLSR
jgi:hypothetical protein